jgi:energy-coupling factor transport system permease protein
MLKDITLGQYFPGESIIHRLDPRTKLIGVIAYIVALFLAQWLIGYGVMAVFLITMIALSGIGFRTVVRGLKPVLFLLIFTGLLNLL